MTDAELLKTIRGKERLSQRELGEIIDCSAQMVHSIEHGKKRLSRRLLTAIKEKFPEYFKPEGPIHEEWHQFAIDLAVRIVTESGWLENHDKQITIDLAHRQKERIPIIPEGWIAITERAPETPGKYKAKGFTRAGRPYTGVAILYPDGNWYTLNGKRMPAPDCWQELAHNIQTVRY